LGWPADRVVAIEGRLHSPQRLLRTSVGVRFPPLCGGRRPSELCRVRGWEKNRPSRLLGALPQRSWLNRLRRLGLEVFERLWRHVHDKSPATQSRWPGTWGGDASGRGRYGALSR
jgi:hypothetical protein